MNSGTALCVAAEGSADVDVLRLVLEPELLSGDPPLKLASYNGRRLAGVFGRSFLQVDRGRLVLFADSDSADPEVSESQRQRLDAEFAQVAEPGRWQTIVCRPEFEAVFFEEPGFTELLIGRPLTPAETALARSAPKHTLLSLFYGNPENARFGSPNAWMRRLGPDPYRRLPTFRRLIEFVHSGQEAAAA